MKALKTGRNTRPRGNKHRQGTRPGPMGRIYHREFIRPVRAYSISITLLSVEFVSFQFISLQIYHHNLSFAPRDSQI